MYIYSYYKRIMLDVTYNQQMQKQKYENVVLFENSDVYWRPADQTSKLYAQLSKKKYREIPRSQIQ